MKKRILHLIIFFVVVTTNAQVSIIGPGGPVGTDWSIDYDLTDSGGGIWTASNITLQGGQFKFRLNHDWVTNWGAATFPNGTGMQGGANIPGIVGTYNLTFNQNTGEYIFSGYQPPASIKLVGTAIDNPNGLIMKTNDGKIYELSAVSLLNGSLQFDIDNSLVGNNTFPVGNANTDLSIPIIAGNYKVQLNLATGDYNFTVENFPKVKIVGSAVIQSEGIEMTTQDGETFSLPATTFLTGNVQFNINDKLYGGVDFPAGIANANSTSIPVVVGEYSPVTINITTGAYYFMVDSNFSVISIIGSAVSGWSIDYDLTTSGDGIWTASNVTLQAGELKFRSNHDWAMNWGAAVFPSGIGTQGGANIPSIAGTYDITFNQNTGEYKFTGGPPIAVVKLVGTATATEGTSMITVDGTIYKVTSTFTEGTLQFDVDGLRVGGLNFPSGIVTSDTEYIPVPSGTFTVVLDISTSFYVFKFPVISITGSAVGGWGVDTDLTTTDGDSYSINNLTVNDGEVRFRQDNNWLISWGDSTSSSGNIVVTAGTYDITFTPSGTYVFGRGIAKGIWTFRDSVTKALVFTNDPALSSKGFNSANFKVYPNPTQNVWNFTSASERIESVKIVDVLGKNVLTVSPKSNNVSVDATILTKGIYFAKIATAKATETIKLMKN